MKGQMQSLITGINPLWTGTGGRAIQGAPIPGELLFTASEKAQEAADQKLAMAALVTAAKAAAYRRGFRAIGVKAIQGGVIVKPKVVVVIVVGAHRGKHELRLRHIVGVVANIVIHIYPVQGRHIAVTVG